MGNGKKQSCSKRTFKLVKMQKTNDIEREKTRCIRKIKQVQNVNTLLLYVSLLNNNISNICYIDYHELLPNNSKVFFQYLQDPLHNVKMVTSINNLQQNLLHTVCKMDEDEAILPLIRLGCNPAKQDYNGRTPFHVALQFEQFYCVKKFLLVLSQNSSEEVKDTQLRENLKQMFRAYNHLGHTIVHQAVQQKQADILKELLNYAKMLKINVLDSEVLGNGDSLLHLAVKQKAVEVQKIIVALIPESLHRRNYAGYVAGYYGDIAFQCEEIAKMDEDEDEDDTVHNNTSETELNDLNEIADTKENGKLSKVSGYSKDMKEVIDKISNMEGPSSSGI